MKKLAFSILFLLNIAIQTIAQGNLVPNYSFENKTMCPNSNGQFYLVTDWENPTIATPDYFDTCWAGQNGMGIPGNAFGFQNTHSGGAYAGIVVYYGAPYAEYLQTQLTEPLQAGQKYCVSFYVSLAEYSDFASIGPQLYFSSTAISSSTFLRFPYTPQVLQMEIIYGTRPWTLISGEYIAQGGERYLTIGNFLEEANTPHDSINNSTSGCSYFFIDDVSVYKKMKANAGANTTICLGDSLQLGEINSDSGIIYNWLPSIGLNDSASHNPWVKPLVTTTYTLSIADTAGLYCPGNLIDSVTITVNDCTPPAQFYVPTLLTAGELFFISALPDNSALELYDARGRLVFRGDNYRNDFNTANLAVGVYGYHLKLPDGTAQTGKVCVVK
jgi:hypothetical protein